MTHYLQTRSAADGELWQQGDPNIHDLRLWAIQAADQFYQPLLLNYSYWVQPNRENDSGANLTVFLFLFFFKHHKSGNFSRAGFLAAFVDIWVQNGSESSPSSSSHMLQWSRIKWFNLGCWDFYSALFVPVTSAGRVCLCSLDFRLLCVSNRFFFFSLCHTPIHSGCLLGGPLLITPASQSISTTPYIPWYSLFPLCFHYSFVSLVHVLFMCSHTYGDMVLYMQILFSVQISSHHHLLCLSPSLGLFFSQDTMYLYRRPAECVVKTQIFSPFCFECLHRAQPAVTTVCELYFIVLPAARDRGTGASQKAATGSKGVVLCFMFMSNVAMYKYNLLQIHFYTTFKHGSIVFQQFGFRCGHWITLLKFAKEAKT